MYQHVSIILQEWYAVNKRDLPWRHTKDPYLIWVSEIILQQTRVAQGLDYYNRFVGRFPNIRSLAEAEQVEVLKYWQGLGYYSRARNLHETAIDICRRWNGIFPERYDDILALKGIGEYTAAAIASLAWNLPYPVVDGNVYRVLGRLFTIETPIDTGKGKKEYRELATLLMPPEQAGLHNQAMMEFGALQCIPQTPDCETCPLSGSCFGYASGNPQQYPVKQNKTKIRNRYLHYFIILHGTDTFIRRRSEKDIWEGLYEFPLLYFGFFCGERFFLYLCSAILLNVMTKVLENLRYAKTHEWVEFLTDTTARIGISDFAQKALGDLVFINLPEEGDSVTAGSTFGDVESVKAVSDVISPVTGEVTAVNQFVIENPELVNENPYEYWFIEVSEITAETELMTASEYEEFCLKEAH